MIMYSNGGMSYVLRDSVTPSDCHVCAFKDDDLNCNASPDCVPGYWEQVGATENAKPSNPKDVLGIRKAPLSVVPMAVVAELGLAMLEGASKYGRANYRAVGVRSSVYFDATMRHLIAFWEGEDVDPDSGLSHLTKAIASLAVWRDSQIQGLCEDDRVPSSKPFYAALNEKAGQILDKHADKNPRHYTIKDTIK